MKIVTNNVNLFIPAKTELWCAFEDGMEEDGNYGWGKTKEEAVTDFLEINDLPGGGDYEEKGT